MDYKQVPLSEKTVQYEVRERNIAWGAMEATIKEMEDEGEIMTADNLFSRAAGFATRQQCEKFFEEWRNR